MSPRRASKDFPGLEQTRFSQLQDEGPAHEVAITRAFYLGQHEVTVGQFRRFVEASGYIAPVSCRWNRRVWLQPRLREPAPASSRRIRGAGHPLLVAQPGFAQTDNDPVVNVSWNDAQAMARWLSRTGRPHLPTAN